MGAVQACARCIDPSKCERDIPGSGDQLESVEEKGDSLAAFPTGETALGGGLPSLVYEDKLVKGEKSEERGSRPAATSVDTLGEVLDMDFDRLAQAPAEAGAEAQAQASSEGADGAPRRPASRRLTRLAAGHGGTSILKEFQDEQEEATGISEFIIKVYDKSEASNYKDLQEKPDSLQRFTARYDGDVWKDEAGMTHTEPQQQESDSYLRYMRLSNLLRRFTRGPHVMDCKIGLRSFAESEAANTKLRPDLYARMVELDPSAPTEEEHAQKACTKHRWMTFNDALTKLPEMGLRVDGIAHSGEGGAAPKKELKKATSVPEVAAAIVKYFLPSSLGENCKPDPVALTRRRVAVAQSILADLKELELAMEDSQFVRSHEFVGCSLLFVCDKHGPVGGVFLIDFAKVSRLPEGISINHTSQWTMGNHEDGLFIGMRTAISAWEEVLRLLR